MFQILKAFKTPFVIALNKVDLISGWKPGKKGIKDAIENQPMHVSDRFQELLMTFQGSLQEHGLNSQLFYDIKDFTKEVAIVPCSARTKEGISELLFVLCGMCQKFLKERLVIGESAKGVMLEVKKEKNASFTEAILYDGILKEGDEIAVANFDGAVLSKVRAIEEIEPLCFKFKNTKKVSAAAGLRVHLTDKEGIVSGMPFQKVEGDFEKIRELPSFQESQL